MAAKEARARIKLNKLLEEAGWRFFGDAQGKANIVLEPRAKLTKAKELITRFEARIKATINRVWGEES